MTDVVLHGLPSGPIAAALSDMLCPPGTVLGRPIDAVGTSFAQALSATQLGAIVRFGRVHELELAAGTYNGITIPNGTNVVDITPTGDVTIGGFIVDAPNFSNYLYIRKRGSAASGQIIFLNNDLLTPAGSRMFTTGAILYVLREEGDTLKYPRFGGGAPGIGRWQTGIRLARPTGVKPAALGELGTRIVLRQTFSATGAAADDVTVVATPLTFNALVADSMLIVGGAVGATSLTIRTAPGGGGVAVSSALSTAATGTVRNNGTDSAQIAAGTQLFLRRTNGNTQGTALIFCRSMP